MGCTASRLANEDTVRRCKDRRRLTKEGVRSRHHLAAAHSDYLRSLRLTASALSRFASLHSLPVVNLPPPEHRRPTTAQSSSSKTVASSVTYKSSSSSSAWDWERFYPPSPPTSDVFDRDGSYNHATGDARLRHRLPGDVKEDSGDEARSSTDESEAESRSEYLGSYAGDDRSGSSCLRSVAAKEEAKEEAKLEVVVGHRDLKEIAAAIEEWFLKAAAAGEPMAELLENRREQLDRSFRRLRKTLYHSSSVLSSLSSRWTSRPPLAVKYKLDTAALEDSGGRESHCSTLERLYAWEKKLYQEVKTREGIKIEHEKKLATLQGLEHKGGGEEKLNKTKAAIQKLQSLIIVTSQAAATTASAIIKVRDDELAPQLVNICHGFLAMWRSMHQCHEVQNHIIQQVCGLAHSSAPLDSASDLHRQATRNLESAVEDWQNSFTRLLKFNREYIHSLYSWLKLTRFEVTSDEVEKDHYSSIVSSELVAFCDDWKQALDRVPDTVAAEAISSFATVIHSISLKQIEELKIKKRADGYSKELDKKLLALQSIERKYYQSYSTVGLKLPGNRYDDQLIDARDPLQEKKSEVELMRRKVAEEMSKHMKAIVITRDMTLNNIQTGLPGVFQAITAFSGVLVEALEGVCHQKEPHK